MSLANAGWQMPTFVERLSHVREVYMNHESLLLQHQVLAVAFVTLPDFTILHKSLQTPEAQSRLVLVVLALRQRPYCHHQLRLEHRQRRRRGRLILTDHAWVGRLVQHKISALRLTRDLRGPNGILERLSRDCVLRPVWWYAIRFDSCTSSYGMRQHVV